MKTKTGVIPGVAVLTAALFLLSAGASAAEPLDQAAAGEADAPAAPGPDAGTRGALPAPEEPEGPANARIRLTVKGLKGGRIPAGERVKAVGRITPYVPGQRISVRFRKNRRVVKRRTLAIKPTAGGKQGRFTLRTPRLLKSARYSFVALKDRTQAQRWARAETRNLKVKYPDVDRRDRGRDVKMLRKLLRKQGYYAPGGSRYDSHMERAVLAYRKVNGMSWNSTDATSGMFKRLAAGKGGIKLEHPGAGKHVEVDISKQVMVLANNRKAKHIFHVSTGASATPSDLGHYKFYRKDPGFNSIGMYYSVYYNRGEATHGYHSVPTYPASHGCIRNPIPDAKFIYGWISLGDSIYVRR